MVIAALGGASAQSASADEAAVVYDPSTVAFIDLTLSAEAESKLEAEPSEYVKGTFSLTKSSDRTPAGEEAAPVLPTRPVEVRLKGSVNGSFRKLSEKAGFKLKFKKADAFLGLRKMTLNNMVQDPSSLHETLAYAAFRAAGIPASRTGYAYVRINGDDIGLFLNLETLDNIALARMFGAFDDKTQHLYEGEVGDDVGPGGETGFEVDEGPEGRGDLKALVEAVNGDGDDPWSTRVAPYANLEEMTEMWAVEKYIDHWDGYSGHLIPALRPNNYYLYSEPSGRFQMLPWGTDQTWIPTIGVGTPGREVTFDGEGGVLFNKCIEDEECFRAYWEALHGVRETIAALDPASLAEDTAALLEPWEEEERLHGRAEFDQGEVEDGVEEALEFIAGRAAEADVWLDANEPPEEESGEGEGEEGGGEEEGEGGESEGGGEESRVPTNAPGAPSASTSLAPAASGTPVPDVVLGRLAVENGVLVSRVWVSGAGTVGQRVSISTRRGRTRVCVTHEQAQQVGPVILRCRLSDAARRRLRTKSVQLRAYTTFVPLDRAGTMAVRDLEVPRDRSL